MPHLVEQVLGRIEQLRPPAGRTDPLPLTSEQRARGHQRLSSEGGRELLLSLPRDGRELEAGDVLLLDDDVAVVVEQADEDVLAIAPRDEREWALAAYNLGNLHRPARYEEGVVLTPFDATVERAMSAAGLRLERARRTFAGERLGTPAAHGDGVHGEGHAHAH